MFYALLHMTPSFWFDPNILKAFGIAIIRVDDRQLESRIHCNRTIVATHKTLLATNLSMFPIPSFSHIPQLKSIRLRLPAQIASRVKSVVSMFYGFSPSILLRLPRLQATKTLGLKLCVQVITKTILLSLGHC